MSSTHSPPPPLSVTREWASAPRINVATPPSPLSLPSLGSPASMGQPTPPAGPSSLGSSGPHGNFNLQISESPRLSASPRIQSLSLEVGSSPAQRGISGDDSWKGEILDNFLFLGDRVCGRPPTSRRPKRARAGGRGGARIQPVPHCGALPGGPRRAAPGAAQRSPRHPAHHAENTDANTPRGAGRPLTLLLMPHRACPPR